MLLSGHPHCLRVTTMLVARRRRDDPRSLVEAEDDELAVLRHVCDVIDICPERQAAACLSTAHVGSMVVCMTWEETQERMFREMSQASGGLTANDLGKRLHLHAGTVRGHLYDLLYEGRVYRTQDASVPNPRGSGAARWRLQVPSLGLPLIADQLLCDACIHESYGDDLRYQRSLTEAARGRRDDEWEADADDLEEIADDGPAVETDLEPTRHCERCGRPRW